MSEKLGTIVYGKDNSEVFLGRDFTSTPRYSEEIAAMIDEEVKAIISEAYDRSETILKEHIGKLHTVAKVLYEKEKLDAEEFGKIMEQGDISDIPNIPEV